MLTGTIDESAIGPFSGSIVDRIFRKFGPEEGARFVDRMTRLAVGFISSRGFSTGISDYDIPENAVSQIEEISTEVVQKINKVIESYNKGLLEPMPGRSLEETLEMEILGLTGPSRQI